ncbi:hypothetical protein V2V90_24660 (plasmid) [Agrobacterium leguminum]|uniref:hypothetical protein n=1 Tax=Agrobacterium leguminum TaxID=2792015 RepID=UPI0030D2306B
MTEQEISYDAIIRAEVAIEILNQARAIVTARIYALETEDPAGAEELRRRRRELVDVQQRIRPEDGDAVENLIAAWGPRVKDEALFWSEF